VNPGDAVTFDEIITPADQLIVAEGQREIIVKLWIARQVVIVLRTLLTARIEGPQKVDIGGEV